jgi:hypothetical protein
MQYFDNTSIKFILQLLITLTLCRSIQRARVAHSSRPLTYTSRTMSSRSPHWLSSSYHIKSTEISEVLICTICTADRMVTGGYRPRLVLELASIVSQNIKRIGVCAVNLSLKIREEFFLGGMSFH